MIRIVKGYKTGVRIGRGEGLNKSVHYWVRIKEAGRLDRDHLWICAQCKTVVAKVKMIYNNDPPQKWELEDAGMEIDCSLQIAASVLMS